VDTKEKAAKKERVAAANLDFRVEMAVSNAMYQQRQRQQAYVMGFLWGALAVIYIYRVTLLFNAKKGE
jgi:hypothetical protein